MSDYFGHLVSRVLFDTTAVQPRLPSAFEPHSRLEVAEVAPDMTAASAPQSIHRAGTQVRRDDLIEAGQRTAPARETHVLEPRRAPAGADSDVDSRADVPLERPVAPNDGELSSVRLPRELVRPAVDQHTDAPVVARVRPVEPTVHASTLPPALPVSSRDPAGRGARASVSDMPFARLDQPRPVLEPPAARPPVVAAHVGSRPARPVPAQSAVTRVGSDAENTIHVTIGRVEIRAASASPASRSSASTSSAMTLGEYLRQRRAPGER